MPGKHIHDINTFNYGGSPTDPADEVALLPQEHTGYTIWRNHFQRELERWWNMSMAIEDMLAILRGCTTNEGAAESEIASLQRWAGMQLPKPYLGLLRRTNGVEGFVADDAYLVLWPAEQVAELNEGYSVAEFAPGLILIGSDGGNTGYALNSRHPSMSIQEVPFVGMSLKEAREVGVDFEDFLRRSGSGGR